jgi:hypothetical protein
LADGLCFDPLLSHIKPNAPETILEISRKVMALTRELAEAEAIFITLGQNEAWYDEATGIYLNMPPPPVAIKRFPGRFSVHLADFQDNLKALETSLRKIRAVATRSPSVILTVSPVPMGNTLSDMDGIAATTYSKSMLRTCAQALALHYPAVDYFPSYAIVLHSDPAKAWHEDTLHVREGMVRFVVREFCDRYLEG